MAVIMATSMQSAPIRYDRLSIALHWLVAALVLAATLVVRIVWRASFGRRLPPANSGLLGFAARAMHLGLYILLGVQVLLGLFSRWLSTEALAFCWL